MNLTWDETPPDRLAVTTKEFTQDDLDEMDVRDYLASDTDLDEGQTLLQCDCDEPSYNTRTQETFDNKFNF